MKQNCPHGKALCMHTCICFNYFTDRGLGSIETEACRGLGRLTKSLDFSDPWTYEKKFENIGHRKMLQIYREKCCRKTDRQKLRE